MKRDMKLNKILESFNGVKRDFYTVARCLLRLIPNSERKFQEDLACVIHNSMYRAPEQAGESWVELQLIYHDFCTHPDGSPKAWPEMPEWMIQFTAVLADLNVEQIMKDRQVAIDHYGLRLGPFWVNLYH